ncbi:MAG TPA: response regulator transcription factor [Candidatus Sulfomarinibacteraceae bacterium]|nr:response regulator transcription factor [Candidatus Sulfomarinibacteraceae bacterium]
MKILIVDEDHILAEILAFTLLRAGYSAVKAHNGKMVLERWHEVAPDLMLLDVNLSDVDGFTLCRRIRTHSNVPIIMLTARDDEKDIVQGLEMGADDYVTKPYSPRQLIARIQAVLRRATNGVGNGSAAPGNSTTVRQAGDLHLDLPRRELRVGQDDPVTLTALEIKLLNYFLLNAGHVLTVDALIDHVWGSAGATRVMLRQLVHRLRCKIEPDTSNPIYIETVPGVGYGLVTSPTNLARGQHHST